MRIIGWSSDVCSSDLGLEIGYRARCDWLQLLQQPVCFLRGGVCLALRYLLVDVLLGEFTKGVDGLEYGDQLLMLAFCKRVGSSFKLPVRLVTEFKRTGQPNIGIAAQGHLRPEERGDGHGGDSQ